MKKLIIILFLILITPIFSIAEEENILGYKKTETISLFDYLQAVENPPFSIRQLAFEVSSGSGQIKEIGYDYLQTRRGLASTAVYLACILYKAGNISDLEQACKILEHIISSMYPNGGHVFPMDGWSNDDNPIASTPIESQALIETILSE